MFLDTGFSREGRYLQYYMDTIPPIDETRENIYPNDGLDAIFNYLVLESDYFFDGTEFDGSDPYDSDRMHVSEASYEFTMYFLKPNDAYYAWGISKCMDDPDEELLGLIEILTSVRGKIKA